MQRLSMKEKVGYALGDVGCGMLFSLIAGFLQIFYTDALLIDPKKVILIFLVARIWDAINDPILGTIIDSRPKLKHGKYISYMRYFSYPLMIFTVIAFVKVPNLTDIGSLVYAYITYIIFGMLYTCVNIPYGALASSMTYDEIDRSSLSFFRSIGSGLGGVPATILLPLLVMTKVVTESGTREVLNHKMLLIGVIIMSLIAFISIQISTRWAKERLNTDRKPASRQQILNSLKTLLSNKAFVAVCLASMFLIAMQMFNTTQQLVLFRDYFNNSKLFSLMAICSYLPMALMIPFINKLIKRYGKKEVCSLGILFSTVSCFLLFLIRTNSPYIFLLFSFFIGSGIIFLLLQIWALVGDVIDYQEYVNGSRDEATTYAFFSFARKLGHTVAGVLAPLSLALSNYYVDPVTQIVDVNTDLLYTWTTLIPAIFCLILFFLIQFLYPINKKMVNEITQFIANKA